MATTDSNERSWEIRIIAKSEDCPERYRKWNPPREGWFCRQTNKKCSTNKCPHKTEEQ